MTWFKFVIPGSLLAVCCAAVLFTVAGRKARELDPGIRQIGIAHWSLEPGNREAFDAVIRRYEALHPGVKIVQHTVPERMFATWLNTKLVGGEAPDIVRIPQIADERLATYFRPISAEVEEPNPYNAGTHLEGVRWRETFVNGLRSPVCLNATLLHYYAVGVSLATLRVYYNRDLVDQLLGPDTAPPRTFAEFMAFCERLQEAAQRERLPLAPMAGSGYNSPMVFAQPMGNQTQRLARDLDDNLDLLTANDDVLAGFLRGTWTLDHPGLRAGLELVQAVGSHMTPGFSQMAREDAAFQFMQGKAVMLLSGIWDLQGMEAGAKFRLRVFRLPVPDRDDPRFGSRLLGPVSEATTVNTAFGLVRDSRHPDVALDFLRFMTSAAHYPVFVETALWSPVIVGVPPAPRAAPFKPQTEGYPAGFTLSLGSSVGILNNQNLHRVFGRHAGIDSFLDELRPRFEGAAREDLTRNLRDKRRAGARLDPSLTAWHWLAIQGADPEAQGRGSALALQQTALEVDLARLRGALAP